MATSARNTLLLGILAALAVSAVVMRPAFGQPAPQDQAATETGLAQATPTPADQAASEAQRGRYGVAIVDGDPAQVRSFGLDWFVWAGPNGLAYTRQNGNAGLPAGVRYPFILPTRTPLGEEELRSLVQRMPGTVWLIGNEPNVIEQDFMDPAVYADELFRYTALIRNADPTARIAGPNTLNWTYTCEGCGGSFQPGKDWTDQMRTAYLARYGGEPPFDIWTLHIYDVDWTRLPQGNAERMIEQVAGFRSWLNTSSRELADRPIWLTEVGIHWGYPGIEKRADGLFYPVGEYDYVHVERWMRTLFGWLNDNAESQKIDKWFLWVLSWTRGEAWQAQWSGVTLIDGPAVNSPVTRLGQLYQELAGVR